MLKCKGKQSIEEKIDEFESDYDYAQKVIKEYLIREKKLSVEDSKKYDIDYYVIEYLEEENQEHARINLEIAKEEAEQDDDVIIVLSSGWHYISYHTLLSC